MTRSVIRIDKKFYKDFELAEDVKLQSGEVVKAGTPLVSIFPEEILIDPVPENGFVEHAAIGGG